MVGQRGTGVDRGLSQWNTQLCDPESNAVGVEANARLRQRSGDACDPLAVHGLRQQETRFAESLIGSGVGDAFIGFWKISHLIADEHDEAHAAWPTASAR